MKRVRIRSMEDLEALPEDEWVEVIGPMIAKPRRRGIRVEDGRLIVPLAKDLAAQIRPRKGERLRATMTKSELTVVRRNAKKPRQPARKRAS